MLFKKEIACEECNSAITPKNICTIDYSRQGRIRHGIKIILCQKCGINKIINSFQEYTQKAVVIQPSSKYNTYAFYSFQELTSASKKSLTKFVDEEYIKDIEKLLPKDGDKCELCSNNANYSWCTINIYNGTPFNMDINKSEKPILVCKNCLSKLFADKIISDNISFQVVFPMIDEIGFYTPWGV